jgi:hypothetical protein
MPPSTKRLAEHEDIARPAPLVLAIIPQRLARLRWQRVANLCYELFAGFIHTNHRALRIVGAMVDFKHVFHPPHEFRVVLFGKTPLLFQPRLNRIFLALLAPFRD